MKRFVSVGLIILFLCLSVASVHAEVISTSAEAFVLYCPDNGELLLSDNADREMPIASTTKIMTTLITLEEAAKDNRVVEFTDDMIAEGSSMYLKRGEKVTLYDLAVGMMMQSGNDAANAAAITIGGSSEGFAELMNQRAAEIGMNNTHFVTPSGLDDDDHYSTAYDLALLMAEGLKNADFAELTSLKSAQVVFREPHDKRVTYTNHNRLLSLYEYCIGGKTGYTSIAMNTLVNGARQEDFTIVTVVLHSDNTQYEDTARMMDFAFANFQSIKASEASTGFSHLADDLTFAGMRLKSTTSPAIDPDSRITLPKTATARDLTWKLDYSPGEAAPSEAIGQVRYYLDDTPVGSAWLTLQTFDDTYSSDPVVERAVRSVLGTSEESGEMESSGDKNAAGPEADGEGTNLFDLMAGHKGMTAGLFAAALIFIAGCLYLRKQAREDALESLKRRARRAERLQDTDDDI